MKYQTCGWLCTCCLSFIKKQLYVPYNILSTSNEWDCKSVCLYLSDDLAKFSIWVNHVAMTRWQLPDRSSVSFSIACLSGRHLSYSTQILPIYHPILCIMLSSETLHTEQNPVHPIKTFRHSSDYPQLESAVIQPFLCAARAWATLFSESDWSQYFYCSWSPFHWRHISISWWNWLQSRSQSCSQ